MTARMPTNRAAAANPSTHHQPAAPPGRCLGREAELVRVVERFEQACAGEPSLVLVTGAGGAGKTTFLADVGRRLRDLGALVLDARCRPSSPSLRPLLELVRAAAEQLRLESDAALVGLSPILDALAGQVAGRGDQDLGSRRVEFFDEIARLLAQLAEARPLALLVQDLESADATTRELVHYLARVLTSRPELVRTRFRGLLVVSAPAAAALVEAGGTEGIALETIELSGLDQAGVRAYLSSEAVVRQVLRVTGGVPGALDAMLAHLGEGATAPSRLDAVRLDPAELVLLRTLAAYGRPLGPETLRLLTGLPQERLARSIGSLVDRQLLEKSIVDGELRLGFVRSGDQALVYNRMSDDERRGLHAAIGAHLESKGEMELEPCAEHLLRGGGGARAVRAALAAGQRLEAALCFERAAELYARALEAASEMPAIRQQLLDRLCTICELTGQLDRALAHASELARAREQDPEAALRVAHLHLIHGDYAAARQELQSLQDALRDGRIDGDRRLSARILAEVADAQHLAGETEAAQASAAKGLLLCCATEGEPAGAQTRLALQNTLAKIHLERDEHEAARSLWESNLELARAAGLPSEEVRALIQLGLALMRAGRHPEAASRYEEARERAEALGELRLLAACHQHRGVLADRRGDLSAAIEAYQQAVGLWKKIGHRSFLAWVGLDLGLLYLRVGDVAKAQAMADLSERLADREPPIAARINVELLRGQIAVREARLGEASERFVRARGLAREAGQVERERRAELELASLALGRRDHEEALAIATAILEDAPHHLRLRALILAADAELALDRPEPATDHLAEARELAEALDDLDATWQVCFQLSRLARAHSRPAEAARLLAEAARGEERARAVIPPEFWDAVAELPQRAALYTAREQLSACSVRSSAQPRLCLHRASEGGEQAPFTTPPAQLQEARPLPRPTRRARCGAIVGGHPRMLQLYEVIEKVAPADATVLIRGESGTGKELVAEAIHRRSRRAAKPLVKVNCGALVESLLLSELFGHERGAFTGATQRKKGRFELADGGTIFLDEIGDISPKTQVALLRVLQEREFERVGGTAPIHVDVRVICATNRDLESMVARGEFREDLYYRLNGVRVEIPALRDRIEDLTALAAHILDRIASERGGSAKLLTAAALSLLESYGWPGNVRELDNVLRSVSLLTDGDRLDAADFADYPELAAWASRTSAQASREPAEPGSGEVATAYAQVRSLGWSLKEYKKRIEVECIREALREADGNITRAAELLGMKRPRLSQLIKEHEIA
jgi:DNA-binding NtrC family response regulator/tetratricopeptide (TPR) repeat protein